MKVSSVTKSYFDAFYYIRIVLAPLQNIHGPHMFGLDITENGVNGYHENIVLEHNIYGNNKTRHAIVMY